MKFSDRLFRAALVAAVPVVLTLLKMAVRGRLYWVWLAEGLIHAGYLGLYWLLPQPHRLFQRLPVIHRVVLGTVVVMMLWGQITHRSWVYFPLVMWGMYCPPAPNFDAGALYLDVVGFDRAGEKVDLVLVDLYPALRNGINVRIAALMGDLEKSKDGPEKERLDDSMRRLLASLRDKYNELHSERPVESVRLIRLRVPIRWEGPRPAPEVVYTYP